jgi:DNA-directed RNA polymerase subunit RPC12/RpoP
MAEQGYCMKCKKKVDIKNAAKRTLKNGRKAMSGTCPKCSTKVFRFLKG